MNVIFRLAKELEGFKNFEETKIYFENELPNRDKNYFYNTRKIKKIQKNDIIYFLYGKDIVAKAKFLGEIYTNKIRHNKFTEGHKVKVLAVFDKGINIDADHLQQKTTRSIGYIDENDTKYLERIINLNDTSWNKMIETKNIILYGAPGVGKTHNTNKLIHLIEEGKSEKEIFEAIQKSSETYTQNEFDDDLKSRVKFVTFHQSFGYEDFIEGFRPNEDGDIKIADGIFKRLVGDAIENKKVAKKSKVELSKTIKFQKELDAFKDLIEEEIEKKGYYSITDAAYLTGFDEDALRYNIRRESPTYKYDLRMKFDDLIKFNESDVSSRQDVKKLDSINSLAKQHASYYFKVFQEIIKNRINIKEEEIQEEKEKNFYLIIDEINRGNISKIFGELITLIEEDKRDSYEVTLPYSKDPFKMPSNLYIIGTMNSTDKSIALIDIALRRRFTFLKMKPNVDLIQFQKAKELFSALNNQIKEDLGDDFQLGHSYFMKIASDKELEFTLEYKIKPLLEEYYYGNKEGYEEILKKVTLDLLS